MTLARILEQAERADRIKDGLVLCENCGNPASLSLSQCLSWTACAPCIWGEADSLDAEDFITVSFARTASVSTREHSREKRQQERKL